MIRDLDLKKISDLTLQHLRKIDLITPPLFEKTYLEYHLDKYSGNVAKLSQAIGLERTHLYRKLNSLGVNFKDKR